MNETQKKIITVIEKVIVIILTLITPYIAFFYILIRRPFIARVNLYMAIYCVLICALIFGVVFANRPSTIAENKTAENTIAENTTAESITANSTTAESTTADSTSDNENNDAPSYSIELKDLIKSFYDEGISYSYFNYTQSDPMKIELYQCTGTFTGKMTKKDHEFSARIGYDRNTGISTPYYLAIDGETIYWDEEGEDAFMESKGI